MKFAKQLQKKVRIRLEEKMRGSFREEELLKKMRYLFLLFFGKILLDIAYYGYISPSYAYMKLETSSSVIKCMESNILLCILFICTPVLKYSVSAFFLNMQLVVTILPMFSYYWLNDQNRIFMYAVCICHILEACLFKYDFFKGNISVSPSKLSDSCIYELIMIFVCIVLMYCIFKYGIPQLASFDFNQIYDIRKNISWEFPFNYFIPWCAKIFIPLGIALGFHRKRYVSAVVLQIFLLIFYLLFPHKSFLFTILFVTAIYLACYKNILYKAIYLVVPGVTILGILIYQLYGSISPLSYLVRRVLFVPAQLKFVYYEFFSQNEKYFFADGQIGRVFGIENRYGLGIARTIGNYMGNSSSANTGYLGEAYAQAGFFGMLLLSILIVVFLKVLEMFVDGQNHIYIISASAFWLYNLNDSTFLTGLLTGGGIMMLLIFAMQGKKCKEVCAE